MIQTVGIVGFGQFGAFLAELAERFAPSVTIRIHSSRMAPDGGRFVSLEEAARCDAVILAVPISAFEETLARIIPHLGERTIVVDVATVKMHTVAALRRLLPGRRYIATHPMFGPQSYTKRAGDVTGMRIVVAEHTLAPEKYAAMQALLKDIGFDVVAMDAERHDKHLAETLFLTHFIGQVVAHAGFDRTAIDTVSFGLLMDAVESVRHDTALFRDVFRFNPYCADTLRRFGIAEGKVKRLLHIAAVSGI